MALQITRHEQLDLPFSCESCGYRGDVHVLGTGQGATGNYVMDAQALSEAREGAIHAAKQNARTLARIAPCPQCGKRNDRGVRDYVFKSAVLTLGTPLPVLAIFAYATSRVHE